MARMTEPSVQQPSAVAIRLRPATDDDIPFLLELRRHTMTAHQVNSGAEASAREREERVLYRFECAQIIEYEGEPAGTLKVTRDGLDWHLVQIQIAPAIQAQGIGTRLVQGLIDEARAAGARLRLNVLRANPALRLYQRLGFHVAEERAHDFEMRLS